MSRRRSIGRGGMGMGNPREEGGMTDYKARRQYDKQVKDTTNTALNQGATLPFALTAAIGPYLFDPGRWKAAKQFQNYYAKSGDIADLKGQTKKLQNANIFDKAGNDTGVPKYEQLSGTNDGGVFSKVTTQEAVDRALAQRQKRIDTMLVGMVY